jgi:hypothetical protein
VFLYSHVLSLATRLTVVFLRDRLDLLCVRIRASELERETQACVVEISVWALDGAMHVTDSV